MVTSHRCVHQHNGGTGSVSTAARLSDMVVVSEEEEKSSQLRYIKEGSNNQKG